jgi:hypothetical protein
MQTKPWVVECASVVVGKVLAAEGDHLGVDVYHVDHFSAGVAKHFSGRGALSSAGYEDAPWLSVRRHGRLDQPFVVDELVRLGGLDSAVQD